MHALKFQAVMLLNGLIGHLYRPVEGRRNDNALLKESQLLERLCEFAVSEDLDDDALLEIQTF